jgi:hypothetical protein
MRQRLAWLSTAPLMFCGLLAGHALGYRLAIPDAHARADALTRSGHGYLSHASLAFAVCIGLLSTALLLRVRAGFRGTTRHAVASPAMVLLPPLAFTVQEHAERLVYSGHMPWTTVLAPSFLLGLALQLPFSLAALLLAWALDAAAHALGQALASGLPEPALSILVPAPLCVPAVPRPAGLARGYGERAPPLPLRL